MIRIGKSTITKGDKNILQDNSIICSFQHDFTNTSIEDTPYQGYLKKQGNKFDGTITICKDYEAIRKMTVNGQTGNRFPLFFFFKN